MFEREINRSLALETITYRGANAMASQRLLISLIFLAGVGSTNLAQAAPIVSVQASIGTGSTNTPNGTYDGGASAYAYSSDIPIVGSSVWAKAYCPQVGSPEEWCTTGINSQASGNVAYKVEVALNDPDSVPDVPFVTLHADASLKVHVSHSSNDGGLGGGGARAQISIGGGFVHELSTRVTTPHLFEEEMSWSDTIDFAFDSRSGITLHTSLFAFSYGQASASSNHLVSGHSSLMASAFADPKFYVDPEFTPFYRITVEQFEPQDISIAEQYPARAVPAPGAVPLISLGIALMGFRRRKHREHR